MAREDLVCKPKMLSSIDSILLSWPRWHREPKKKKKKKKKLALPGVVRLSQRKKVISRVFGGNLEILAPRACWYFARIFWLEYVPHNEWCFGLLLSSQKLCQFSVWL